MKLRRRARAAAILAVMLFSTSGCSPEANAPPPAKQPAEVARPQGDERIILAFGDSLYAGYGLAKGEGLPAQLEARLRRAGVNATLVDAGVSGDTTAAGRQRLTFVLDAQKRAPDLVILGLGGNDVLRQLSPAETRANLAAMLDELKRRNIPVLLTGMRSPPNLGPDHAAAFEPIWPELAAQYGAALYPFILEGVITDPALMQRDGVHPTAAGVAKMADAIAPLAVKALPPK